MDIRFPDETFDIRTLEELKSGLTEGDAASYAELARYYLDIKLVNEAGEIITEGLAAFPDEPGLLEMLAQLKIASGNYDEAERTTLMGLNLQPDNVVFMVNLAIVHSYRGDHEKSFEWLRKAKSMEPNNPEVRLGTGIVCLKLGRIEKAFEELEQVKALEVPHYLKILGKIYRQNNRMKDAVEVYSRLLALEPSSHSTQAILGKLHLESGNTAGAMTYLENAVTLAPDRPEYQNLLGIALSRQDQAEEALDRFEKAMRLNPANPQYHYLPGLELMKRRNFVKAAEYLESARNLEPSDSQYQTSYAISLMYLGEDARAEDEFRKAIALNPECSESHQNLGLICQKMGKLEEARDAFVNALKLDGCLFELYSNLRVVCNALGESIPPPLNSDEARDALFNHAQILMDFGRIKEASKLLECVLDIDPDHSESYYILGDMFMKKGNLDTAIEYFQEAIELEDDEYYLMALSEALEAAGRFEEAREVMEKLGNFYSAEAETAVDEGRYDDAVRLYREAVELCPEDHKSRYNLGLVCHFRGELERAIELFEALEGSSQIDQADLAERIAEVRNSICGGPRVVGTMGMGPTKVTVMAGCLSAAAANSVMIEVTDRMVPRKCPDLEAIEAVGEPLDNFLRSWGSRAGTDAGPPLPGAVADTGLVLPAGQRIFVGMVYAAGNITSESIVGNAVSGFVKSSLAAGLKKVAMPPVGGGAEWFGLKKSAAAIAEALMGATAQEGQGLEEVVVVSGCEASAKELLSYLRNRVSGF